MARRYPRIPCSRFSILILLVLILPATLVAADPAPDLADYLPPETEYDPSVPKPADVLGFEVGEFHVRHDQLVAYMRALADASPRVTLEVTGHTHERRPLIVLTISDPANLAGIEAIRQRHLARANPTAKGDAASRSGDSDPVVVYLGYSVHGDEASGANASLAVAYHLAAAQDDETRRWLRESVILLDPSLNPDGLGRFAQWVNMHKGDVLVADPAHREHNQYWPSGRTNHYWFDLNRDWLLAQHPESRARLGTFHRWRPNVHTDHHEMGTNATFFFQPGVPSRKNPLTPDENVDLTSRIAGYHGRALDQKGRLYYTEESFDDFYYGKGSTYPDIHGGIGILFEQASVRGHLQESSNGTISFPFGIQNQVTVSFSTLRAAVDMRGELLDYQARFFRDAWRASKSSAVKGWIFGDAGDAGRARALAKLLGAHKIEVRSLARQISVNDRVYQPGHAWVVDSRQPQALLIRTLFETMTTFADSTFYDVSTWTLPLAFGLPYNALDARALAAATSAGPTPDGESRADIAFNAEAVVAWAFDWDSYWAPRGLDDLLSAGVKARVATESFVAPTPQGPRRFELGSVVVPRGLEHDVSPEELGDLLAGVGELTGIDIVPLVGGLTPEGIDLGSPSLRAIEAPEVGIVVGPGISMYEAGQAWHLLDHRMQIATSLLDRTRIARGQIDLDRYTHLIMVDGEWSRTAAQLTEQIASFVEGGGVVLAIKRAAVWADRSLFDPENESQEDESEAENGEEKVKERRPYGDRRADRAIDLVSGAIFAVDLDPTHPVAYGYRDRALPVFRNSAVVFKPEPGPYTSVAVHTDSPLLSGYASDKNVERIAGSPALTARRLGAGLVVRYAFDPNFRAFWYGTNKLFLNPLFMSGAIDPAGGRQRDAEH